MSCSKSENQLNSYGNSYEFCPDCKDREIFGARSKDSFNCICKIDGREVRKTFYDWCISSKIFDSKDKKSDEDPKSIEDLFVQTENTEDDSLPTLKDIHQRLENYTSGELVQRLFCDSYLDQISGYVFDVHNTLLTKKNLPSIKEWEYLDVCCGNAKVCRAISSELGVMNRCVDIVDMRIGKLRIDNYEDFQIFDGKNLPFEDHAFGLITCNLALHHIKDTEVLIGEIFRVLKDDGIFIYQEMDCESWADAYSFDFMNFQLGKVLKDDMTTSEYRSRKGWRRLIANAGFTQKDYFLQDPPYKIYFEAWQKCKENY